MTQRFLSLFILIILANCHFSSTISSNQFSLLSVKKLNKTITLYQNLKGSYKDNDYDINLVTDITPREINVIGLSEFGNRLFSIKYNDLAIDFETIKYANLHKKINPEYIIADIQLTYWPLPLIQKSFGKNVRVIENISKDQIERVFYDKDKIIIKITYTHFLGDKQKRNLWQSDVNYINFARGYQYTIKNS